MRSDKVKGLFLIALGAIIFMFSACQGKKELDPDKAAVVNGVAITVAEVDREWKMVEQRASKAGRTFTDSEILKLKEEALEELINAELLYQESQKRGIQIDEEEVTVEFQKWKKQFPSENEYQNFLDDIHITSQGIRDRIKHGLSTKNLIRDEFMPNQVVTEKELKDYYDAHPEIFRQPEQVHASHILIKVESQAGEEGKSEAKTRIERIQKRVANGEEFAVLAKELSDCPSRARGGDLGFFRRGQMVRPFEEAAFALEPGQVSDVVETKFGYHLIKSLAKKPPATLAFEDVKENIALFLRQEKARKEVEQYLGELKDVSEIERYDFQKTE